MQMQLGFRRDHLAEMAQWITASLKSQKVLIDQQLELPQEVGGQMNLDSKEQFFKVVKEGNPNEPTIVGNIQPQDTTQGVLMNWHTHPNSLQVTAKDGLPKDAIRNVPSWMDIETLTRASIQYREPAVEIVISKQGFFFVRPSDDFLAFLLRPEVMSDHELIFTDILKDNIGHIAYKQFRENLSIQDFCEEMSTVFVTDTKKYGQDCVYIPRPSNF